MQKLKNSAGIGLTLFGLGVTLVTWLWHPQDPQVLKIGIGLGVVLALCGLLTLLSAVPWGTLALRVRAVASQYEFAWPIKRKRGEPERHGDAGLAFKNLLEHVARDNWPKKEERIYSPLTCRDVVDTYRRHRFKSEAEQELKRHIGTWMRHEGTFSDRDCEGRRLIFSGPLGKATVFAWFDQEWVNRVSILAADRDVKIEGKISEIADIHIELKNCELVD